MKTVDEILYSLMNTALAFGRNPQLNMVIGGSPVAEAKVALQALVEEALNNIIGEDMYIGDEIAENKSYTGERIHNALKHYQRSLIPQVISKMFGDTTKHKEER